MPKAYKVNKKLLFICSENKLRSATAEVVFSKLPGIEAIGAGTNYDAETPVSGDLIEWADTIYTMENIHKKKCIVVIKNYLKEKELLC